jgi:hypothetical protein
MKEFPQRSLLLGATDATNTVKSFSFDFSLSNLSGEFFTPTSLRLV